MKPTQYQKKDGYYIIIVNAKQLYMRSHPKDRLLTMKMKKHDKFIAFKDTNEHEEHQVGIEQLQEFINIVERLNK